MRQAFKNMRLSPEITTLIQTADGILTSMHSQGYTLTLRQLYYQLVATNAVTNDEKSYKRVGKAMSDGRLCGLLDWDHMEDRTRNVRGRMTWDSAADAIRDARDKFALDLWKSQPAYVEVWVEKDALLGVMQVACRKWRVPYFASKGYNSQSEMHEASLRFWHAHLGILPQECHIIYLGDHDPSGKDISDHDMPTRLRTFGCQFVRVHRVALNIAQVRKYKLPPNFAKATDTRFYEYQRQFGTDCWELDALSPQVVVDLVEKKVERLMDLSQWDADLKLEATQMEQMAALTDNWKKLERLKWFPKTKGGKQ